MVIGTNNPLAKLHVTGSSSVPSAIFIGNVGIGSTSPGALLDVNGLFRFQQDIRVNNGTDKLILSATSTTTELHSAGTTGIVFKNSGNNEIVRFDAATGNVGIGTSSPAAKLDVVGSAAISSTLTVTGTTALNGAVNLSTAGTPTVTLGASTTYGVLTATGTNAASIYLNGATRTGFEAKLQFGAAEHQWFNGSLSSQIMTLNTTGLGIGTTSPAVNLVVYNASGWSGTDLNGTSGGELRFLQSGSLKANIYASTSTGFVLNGGSETIFQIGASEKMRLTGANLGIGTTGPVAFLDIVGNGIHTILRNTSATSYTSLRLYNNQNSALRTLEIDYSGASYSGALITGGPTGESACVTTTGAYPLALGTNNTARMTILSDGNVGIGTSSPAAKLDIASTQSDGIIMRYDTSTAYQAWIRPYWNSTADTRIDFAINRAANSTPDVIMSVGYGGNVGIGTTAPGARLEISSSTAASLLNVKGVGGNAILFVSGSGTVGIGTTSPSQLLHVYKSNSGGLGGAIMIDNNNLAVANETALMFGDGGASYIRAAISSTTENAPYYGDIKFKTGLSVYSSLTTRMIIKGDGNVGIGTTLPAYKLDVNSSIVSRSNISTPRFSSAGGYVYGVTNSPTWVIGNGSSTNNNATAPDATTTAGTYTLSATSALQFDLYQNITGLTVGRVYTIGMWVKLGTATNFCLVVNNSAAWNTIGGKAFTSSDGLSTGKWTHISYTFTQPAGSNQINLHLGYHLETGVTQQTAGTVFLWNIEMTEFSSTWIGNVEDEIRLPGSSIWTSRGNVGVGTTVPTVKLDVNGAINTNTFMYVSYPYGNAYPLQISANNFLKADDYYYGMLIRSGDVNYISGKFQINGGSNKRVEISGYEETIGYLPVVIPGGNVGIGTTSPDSKLHIISDVAAGTNNYALRLQNTTTVSDARVGIAFLDNSQTASNGSGATIQVSNNGVDGGGNLLFGSLLNGTNTERMRIKSDGNVGIGTTSPGALLEISSSTAASLLNVKGAGGNAILFVSGSGNVGIGTTTLTGILTVYKAGAADRTIHFENGTTAAGVDAYIAKTLKLNLVSGGKNGSFDNGWRLNAGCGIGQATNNGYLAIEKLTAQDGSSSTEVARFDTAGNLGIGTTAPAAKLHVSGSGQTVIRVEASTTTNVAVFAAKADTDAALIMGMYGGSGVGNQFGVSAARQAFIGTTSYSTVHPTSLVIGNVSNIPIAFGTDNTERMRITSDGNVGIGTTSPAFKLHVANGDITIANGNQTSGDFSQAQSLHFLNETTTPLATIKAVRTNWAQGQTDLTFSTYNSGMGERMRIDSGGNVGIGTTTPFGTTANRTVLSVNGTTDVSLNIGSGGSQRAYLYGVSSYAELGTIGSLPLRFAPNNSEKMRLDANGNLGIGTTSVATKLYVVSSGSPIARFDGSSVATSGATEIDILGPQSNGDLNLGIGGSTFTDATNNIQNKAYITAGTGLSGLNLRSDAGYVQITAGGLASSYEVARFTSTGNVGIGTTVPSASLHINSTTSGATLLRTDGTNGTLFSVVDDLSDSLMSVNNSAGLPVLEVFADDRIVGGQYGQNDLVVVNNKVGIGTNNPLAKLHVTGSASVPAAVFMGNVGIGTTSFVYSNANRGDIEVYGSTDALISLRNDTANSYLQKSGNDFYFNNGGAGFIAISTNGSERMRITSTGVLLVGNTSAPNPGAATTVSGFAINGSGNDAYISHKIDNGPCAYFRRDGTDGFVLAFYKANSSVGTIAITATTTTYNTTSDYRLKENIQPLSSGLVRVNSLKPSVYNWKSDGSNGEGFLAHELAEVVPIAVTGQKDAVNDDGSIIPQSVDMSKVVPILVAAIQELSAKVKTLEAKVQILESK